MKIALGTVQFGMEYGVANTDGRVTSKEIQAVLETARLAGIDTLDTAAAYGNSEQMLGNAGVDGFKVISKLPPRTDNEKSSFDWVRENVERSLENIQSDFLYGLLLHRPMELLQPNGCELYKMLLGLKKQGLVEKIGVSVYGPEDLDELSSEFTFDIVQAPMNILDRRFEKSGWLGKLNEAGVEIHVRSAFLQGLMLMPSIKRPAYFQQWEGLLKEFDIWTTEQGLSPLQACLGYLNHCSEIDKIVVGVESAQQLREIISAMNNSKSVVPSHIQSDDLNLINPAFWKL